MDTEGVSCLRVSDPMCPAEDASADRVELEAAEALAGLAWSAVPDSAATWGSKGKRVRKRVKSESPPPDIEAEPVDPVQTGPDRAEDRATIRQQHNQIASRNSDMKPVKVENGDDTFEQSSMCAPRYASTGGGRSRQKLSEDEKEARRLRRILANRESARQAIRRRQALYEELRQKAADLKRENENLMREKKLVLMEYQSLENTNKHLKGQMGKVVKAEGGETSGGVKLSHPWISASSSTNIPLFLYNHQTSAPFCWPSMIQSLSHPFQSQPGFQNPPTIVSSSIPVPIAARVGSSRERECPLNINGQNGQLYVVPCPWFFPFPENGSGLRSQPSSGPENIKDEVSLNNSFPAESCSRTIHIERNRSSLSVKVENNSYGSEGASSIDLNAFPVKLGSSEGQNYRFHQEEKNDAAKNSKENHATTTPFRTALTARKRNVSDYFFDEVSEIEAAASRRDPFVSALPGGKEPINNASKKVQDALPAAEARRKRKELAKLQNLHGRQCRMHC